MDKKAFLLWLVTVIFMLATMLAYYSFKANEMVSIILYVSTFIMMILNLVYWIRKNKKK